MAVKHFHCVQRNTIAEVPHFHAQDFAAVVEHVTVNSFNLFFAIQQFHFLF